MNTRSAIVVGVLALGAAAAFVLVRTPHSSAASAIGKTGEIKTAPTPAKTVSADRNAPEFYGENVRPSLFAGPLPPLEAPARVAPRPFLADPPHVVIADPVPDPFADYVYTGTLTIDGQVQALLENPRTEEGWYLHPGDAFMEAKVITVEADAVTLEVHGQKRRILKSDAYNVVPLNAQAPLPPDEQQQRVYLADLQGALQAWLDVVPSADQPSRFTIDVSTDSSASERLILDLTGVSGNL